MPRVLIHTNLKDTDLPSDFEENVVQKISDVLKYPLEIVYLTVSTGNRMINNGKKTPMLFVDIESVNRFNPEVNDDYSKIFIRYFTTLLKLPETRIVMKYHDLKVSDFGVVRKAPEFKSSEHFVDLKMNIDMSFLLLHFSKNVNKI